MQTSSPQPAARPPTAQGPQGTESPEACPPAVHRGWGAGWGQDKQLSSLSWFSSSPSGVHVLAGDTAMPHIPNTSRPANVPETSINHLLRPALGGSSVTQLICCWCHWYLGWGPLQEPPQSFSCLISQTPILVLEVSLNSPREKGLLCTLKHYKHRECWG